MHVYLCMCIHTHTHTHIYTHTHTFVYACNMCIYPCTYVHTYIHTYIQATQIPRIDQSTQAHKHSKHMHTKQWSEPEDLVYNETIHNKRFVDALMRSAYPSKGDWGAKDLMDSTVSSDDIDEKVRKATIAASEKKQFGKLRRDPDAWMEDP
jgi:hypothetical protein